MAESTSQGQAGTQVQDTKPADGTGTTPEPTTLEAIQKEFETIKSDYAKREEQYKQTIAGLNRKISEDEKAIQLKEIEKLKGIEREQAETKLLKEEKEKLLRETEQIRRDRIKEKALIDNNIPVEFINRISGESESDIIQDVQNFKKFIDAQVQKGIEAEINKRLGGTPPASGATPGAGGLQGAYDEAKKENKIALMTAIQRKAQQEGVQINL